MYLVKAPWTLEPRDEVMEPEGDETEADRPGDNLLLTAEGQKQPELKSLDGPSPVPKTEFPRELEIELWATESTEGLRAGRKDTLEV